MEFIIPPIIGYILDYSGHTHELYQPASDWFTSNGNEWCMRTEFEWENISPLLPRSPNWPRNFQKKFSEIASDQLAFGCQFINQRIEWVYVKTRVRAEPWNHPLDESHYCLLEVMTIETCFYYSLFVQPFHTTNAIKTHSLLWVLIKICDAMKFVISCTASKCNCLQDGKRFQSKVSKNQDFC